MYSVIVYNDMMYHSKQCYSSNECKRTQIYIFFWLIFSLDSTFWWQLNKPENRVTWSVVFMPDKYCHAATHVPRLFLSKKQILVWYIKLSGANVDFTLTSISVNLPLCLYPIAVFVTVLFPFLYRHCLHLSVSLQPPSIVNTIPMVQHCMNMDHSEFE